MNIGILTCSATTQDLACSSFNCLQHLYEGKGKFSKYNGNAKLVGIINCGGCIAYTAPDKLLKRVRSLTELNPDAIHLSTCMTLQCPFKDKYFKLLSKNFPNIQFVKGTHAPAVEMSDDEHIKVHKKMVGDLINSGKTMGDMIPILYTTNK